MYACIIIDVNTFYLYQFTIAGVIQIEFLEDSLTVKEEPDPAQVCVFITSSASELGCC